MKTTGFSFLTFLFLILIILKLAKIITWSWWIILLPIWLPAIFIFGVIVIGIILPVCLAKKHDVDAFKNK